MKKTFIAALVAVVPMTALAAPYTIDESHSSASFSVRHMMVTNTTGEFKGIKGTIDLDEKNLTKSKVDVTIDVATVDTRDAKRDEHLKSADFFDVATHPTMKFTSKKITKKGKQFLVSGDLTIRGKTKEVTLTAEITEPVKHAFTGQLVRGVHATTTIDRRDFDVSWNKDLDKGGVLVGNDVKISIDLELVPAEAQKS